MYDGTNNQINAYDEIKEISGEYYASYNSIIRTKPCPDEYEGLLTETFDGVTSSDPGVYFFEVKDKAGLVGSEYILYRKDVDSKEPYPEVAI